MNGWWDFYLEAVQGTGLLALAGAAVIQARRVNALGNRLLFWELDALRRSAERLDAVRALHPRTEVSDGAVCGFCGQPYPCATVRAIEGTSE